MPTINFLDGPKPIVVETGLALSASWGDRVSRQQDGPGVYGEVDGLMVECVSPGPWWEPGPVEVRGFRRCGHDRYPEELPAELAEQVRATRDAVVTAWKQAVETDPVVAEAVEAYRQILDGILEHGRAHEAQWQRDALAIAKAFRRKTICLGEQTVPGKICVRSARGNLLGYADCWDGHWQGTIERI